MNDEEFKSFLLSQGFIEVRKLDDGEWIGLLPLMFTMSVCCGVTEHTAFKYRWCFADESEAIRFYTSIKDYDDIPDEKYRASLKGHRYLEKPLLIEKDELGLDKW